MTGRTPSLPVRRNLRKEVNFGCPICGIPYLTWHHFDPPWEIEQHERAGGMIALCHICHDHADGGAFTKEQLHDYKSNPCIKNGEISAKYHYLRRNTVCRIGDSIGYKVKDILTIDGERVIGFERDEDGYDRLNIVIRGYLGNKILEMENNDWTVYTKNLFDIECPARGKSLKVVSKDRYTNFELRFDDLDEKEFKELLMDLDHDVDYIDRLIKEIKHDNPDKIPLWTLKGKISYSNMDIVADDKGMKVDIDGILHNGTLSRIIAVGAKSLLNLNTNTNGTNMLDPFVSLSFLQERKNMLLEELRKSSSMLGEIETAVKRATAHPAAEQRGMFAPSHNMREARS